MAEEFLTLMADLDDESQQILSGWYKILQGAGFTGVQTPNLPFHISMATFSLDKESAIINEMDKPETVQKALPFLVEHFHTFMGRITRLHLCAFWPTREIHTVYLKR